RESSMSFAYTMRVRSQGDVGRASDGGWLTVVDDDIETAVGCVVRAIRGRAGDGVGPFGESRTAGRHAVHGHTGAIVGGAGRVSHNPFAALISARPWPD